MTDETRRRPRSRNDGLRKLCECPRRGWAKCEHPWHFNFAWTGESYRFSLERQVHRVAKDPKGVWKRDRATLGERITDKTTALRERDRLRTAICAGTLQGSAADRPLPSTLNLGQLFGHYRKQHVAVHRADTAKNADYIMNAITRQPLARADGELRPFGEWLVADVTTEVIEQYRAARLPSGATSSNRHLELLRHLFNWATAKARRLAADNPFLDGATAAVRMLPEQKRQRRLYAGEREKLLAAASPHLWAVVQCAIETGMRRGEILSLQWSQIRLDPTAGEILLTAAKTKTKRDRKIPISATLRPILEMRRSAPDGGPHPPDAYVFGDEAGGRVTTVKRAWQAAVLRANGYKPEYVVLTVGEGTRARTVRQGLLTKESQARLRAINLHFHDLRREAGSRWLDGGVPLTKIQAWLGHTTVAQTSTYLMADASDDHAAMQRFEARRAELQRCTKGEHEAPPSATTPDGGTSTAMAKLH